MMKLRFLLFWLALTVCAAFAAEQASPHVLPQQFAGWQLKGASHASPDASNADEANSNVLKEYSFSKFESATYVRDDGRKLTIRLAQFEDATGAFGAFTFYRQPEMLDEKIGDQGASFNNRVLFYRGNNLVDAVFDKLTVMSAAELRELAGALPLPSGNTGRLPLLPGYLPKQRLIKNSEKFVAGPAALAHASAPIAPDMVDFKSGAEVVLGRYDTSAGQSTLMLIEYPTPQIAAERLRQIDAAHQSSAQQPGVATIVDAGSFFDKRTGPIIAIAAGPLSQSEAKSLLASVSYDADVTWNENTSFTKKDNLANLLVNIIVLCGLLIGFGLVAGVAFGGLRVLLQRVLPERVLGRPEEVEFISLHLEDAGPRPPRQR
jgi:uncharacterized protein DUF6599